MNFSPDSPAQPPEAHLSHKDNANLSAREPRESDDRHSVDVEHLEVLGGRRIIYKQRDRRSALGASPASSGFRRRNILLAALCAAVRRGGPPRITVVPIAMPGHGVGRGPPALPRRGAPAPGAPVGAP